MLYLAFPPVGWWPLAPVGVAGAALVVRDLPLWRSYRLSVLVGLAFLLPMLRFTAFVGLDAWLLLAVAEAAIFALLGPATTLVMRLRGWPVGLALLWVAQEALRGREPFGGFPWGRLAFSQPGSPFTALAAVGGAPLVTFAVALSGGLLAAATLGAHRAVRGAPPADSAASSGSAGPTGLAGPGRTRGWVRPVALLSATVAVGAVGLAVPLPTGAQAGSVNVAAIQGNVPNDGGLAALGRAHQVTADHLAGTLALAARVRAGQVARPDLVLWPENSSDLDPFVDPVAAAMLSQASRAIGEPILVGAVLDGPGAGHVRNAGLTWGPNGWLGQLYVKQHPVPFAEYLPGRSVLQQVVHRFAVDMPNDFVKGRAPGAITLNGVRIGDIICFEVAYDGLVRSAVDHGARLLVVQTNNASFGRKGESQQQLAMTRLRAVEFGRATVQVSTSGQSALIAPDGRVLTSSGLYEAAQLSARLPLRTSRTLADRLGVWPETAMVILGLLALAAGLGSLRSAGPAGAPRRPTRATPVGDIGGKLGDPGAVEPDQGRGGSGRAGPGSGRTGGGDRGADDGERSRVDGDRIVVCVPTYNERENLREIVTRLRTAVAAADVLVIDDGSPDGTGRLADELAAADAHVRVLHRSGKAGLGAAYVAGFSWALDQGYDVVVEMDADGSHQPEDLPRLLEALPGADLVIGSRWVRGGEVRNWPMSRKVLSRGANVYVRAALGMPVADATAGFRAYRAAVLRDRPLTEVTSQGYCFQVDLAWQAWRDGFAVTEVPITFVERQRGQSKMSRAIIAEALWRVTWWSVRSMRGGPRRIHPESTVGQPAPVAGEWAGNSAEPTSAPGPADAADAATTGPVATGGPAGRPSETGEHPDRVSA